MTRLIDFLRTFEVEPNKFVCRLLKSLTNVGDSVQENTSSAGVWSGRTALEIMDRTMTAARDASAV